MKLGLKDFQTERVSELFRAARRARTEAVEDGKPQAVVFSAPTGSGKTLMTTALMERILQGDEQHPGDPDAVFLWLTDAPELNEQSRRKVLAGSSVFRPSDVVTIETTFSQDRLDPGKLNFLNTQKLGAGGLLVTPGDERPQTIWETIRATVEAAPGSFWLVIDEAHRGMHESKADRDLAATIVQRFLKGSDEMTEIPLVVGVTATPDRFVALVGGRRTPRRVDVSPADVRESGLLKDIVYILHPTSEAPSDHSLLRAAAEQLVAFEREWADYCDAEGDLTRVRPALVVQVEDAASGKASKTDLVEALRVVEEVLGPLPDAAVAHAFQEGQTVDLAGRPLRRVAPPDIQDDPALRVVFFKTSLNTGWDCPRAEVMMSFRRAADHTAIAQLVGRMVRTPLARRVDTREMLNTVSLYLPHYDKDGVARVVSYLTDQASEGHAPVHIEDGNDVVDLARAPGSEACFEELNGLPNHEFTRLPRVSDTKRLLQFARALAQDKVDLGAIAGATGVVLDVLASWRATLAGTPEFRAALARRRDVSVRRVAVDYLAASAAEAGAVSAQTVEADIEEMFDAAGRKLGEGLHAAYARARAAEGVGLADAKVELSTLLDDRKVLGAVEAACDARVQVWFKKHQVAVNKLGDGRQQVYARIRRTAAKPAQVGLALPDTIQVRRVEKTWKKHLYVDGKGDYPYSPTTSWETRTVEEELARPDVVGWLRNTERKPWALRIPYKLGGEVHRTYPDFLVVRAVEGGLLPDILEPHRLDLEDFPAKAAALAEYAGEYGHFYGRIEIITQVESGGPLVRLDLNDEKIRDKVKGVADNTHLRQIFEADGR